MSTDPRRVTLSQQPLDVQLAAQRTGALAVDQTARTVTGTITEYGVLIPSHGLILEPGCLQPRTPVSRVKLLRDHNQGDPLGSMVEVDDAVEVATFQLPEGENGDRALAEAENGLRDGFSVGFTFLEYGFDDDFNLHVYAAELYEVSLCAIPAVANAGVSSVSASIATARKAHLNTMNEAQLRAALAAGTITQETFDAQLAALRPAPAAPAEPATPATPAAPVPAELSAGPEPVPLAPAVVVSETLTLGEASRKVALAARRGIGAVQLALEEITYTEVVAADAGTAFAKRPDWVGEIFQFEGQTGRPIIESLGGAQALTGDRIEGWKWVTTPVPAKYAGDLAEVPGNGFSTTKVSFEPERWAWAARLDRKLVDLGSADLVAALFQKLALGYDQVSDADVATTLITRATSLPDSPSLLAALADTARRFRTLGATLSHVRVADDVFEEFAELKINDLPAWLALKLGVSLTDGTATVADIGLLEADSKLANGQFLAYDKRAATVKEKRIPNLEAVVIPNGGIDLGFFSYGGTFVEDARGVVKRQIVPTP